MSILGSLTYVERLSKVLIYKSFIHQKAYAFLTFDFLCLNNDWEISPIIPLIL